MCFRVTSRAKVGMETSLARGSAAAPLVTSRAEVGMETCSRAMAARSNGVTSHAEVGIETNYKDTFVDHCVQVTSHAEV